MSISFYDIPTEELAKKIISAYEKDFQRELQNQMQAIVAPALETVAQQIVNKLRMHIQSYRKAGEMQVLISLKIEGIDKEFLPTGQDSFK